MSQNDDTMNAEQEKDLKQRYEGAAALKGKQLTKEEKDQVRLLFITELKEAAYQAELKVEAEKKRIEAMHHQRQHLMMPHSKQNKA